MERLYRTYQDGRLRSPIDNPSAVRLEMYRGLYHSVAHGARGFDWERSPILVDRHFGLIDGACVARSQIPRLLLAVLAIACCLGYRLLPWLSPAALAPASVTAF